MTTMGNRILEVQKAWRVNTEAVTLLNGKEILSKDTISKGMNIFLTESHSILSLPFPNLWLTCLDQKFDVGGTFSISLTSPLVRQEVLKVWKRPLGHLLSMAIMYEKSILNLYEVGQSFFLKEIEKGKLLKEWVWNYTTFDFLSLDCSLFLHEI